MELLIVGGGNRVFILEVIILTMAEGRVNKF